MKYPADRPCPLTGAPPHHILGYMPAGLVVAANPTYRPEALSILGLAADDAFPIARSPAGFAYAAWLPDAAFLKRVYEEAIDHTRSSTGTVWYRQFLLELAARALELVGPTDRPIRVLDYGCGYGALLEILACRDVVAVGYEPSGARRTAAGDATREGRIEVVSRPDEIAARGPFDLVICTEVLEHLADPAQALEALRANARPGAALLVTVPCCTAAYMQATLEGFASGRPQSAMFNPWEHLNYFRPEDLRSLLARGGFRPVADLGRLQPARLALTGGAGGLRGDLAASLRAAKRLLTNGQSTQLLCRAQ